MALIISAAYLSAQVSNVRISQYDNGIYKVLFDLNGDANDDFYFQITANKGGTTIKPHAVGGMKISKVKKDNVLVWDPVLDGREAKGWELSLKANKITGMVYVEGGSFQMGSNDGEIDEKPVHRVAVSSFYIGKYEVTQKQWQAVMGNNPSNWKGDNLPVEQVNWYDCVEFCNKLSRKEGLTPCYSGSGSSITCDWTANGYRLPTEAEWEFSARGGNQSKGDTYSGSNTVGDVAWYGSNSGGKTHPVGQKQANEQGIYDMSGNVWEWCWDWYDSSYYGKSPAASPKGADGGSSRLLRGGSWNDNDRDCRVANRLDLSPGSRYGSLGLRIVRGYGSD